VVVVAESVEGAVKVIEGGDSRRLIRGKKGSSREKVGFVFSGQGSQYVEMGKGLYETQKEYREEVRRCAEMFRQEMGEDLIELLYGKGDREEREAKLMDTAVAQAALYTVEVGMSKMLMKWGIRPDVMIGHSIGEYVAASISGVLEIEEAVKVVSLRGRLMSEAQEGRMIAIEMAEAEAEEMIRGIGGVWIAAVNGARRCVLSGEKEAIEEMENEVKRRGRVSQRLRTGRAFHSEMMREAAEKLAREMRRVKMRDGEIEYMSNVTGKVMRVEELEGGEYWGRQMVERVRFWEGIEEMRSAGVSMLIELGPGRSVSRVEGKRIGLEVERVMNVRGEVVEEEEQVARVIGGMWARGAEVDWEKYYEGERRRRVGVPGYAFQRKRFWLEMQQADESKNGNHTSNKKLDIKDWFYIPSWKRTIPAVSPGYDNQPPAAGCCLVFAGDSELASEMVKRLRQQNREVISVAQGQDFNVIDEELYTINPALPENYDLLFKDLRKRNKSLNCILHLWAVTPGEPPIPGKESFASAQSSGFYSLLYIAQALGRDAAPHNVHIWVFSNGLHDITGDELLQPEKATLLGACKVIPKECPNLSCRSIDIVLPQGQSEKGDELAEQLMRELGIKSSETVIAYRGGHRWAQSYEAVSLEETKDRPSLLREKGVYLITGGLGGIGLALARYLAESVQARLVLVSRSALSHSDENDVTEKINKVSELEELGAEVLALAADVADEEQMRSVISQVNDRFGSLHGVIHAAGVAGGGVIQLKLQDAASSVIAPKASGALIIDRVLEGVKLDFLVLCSSITSITGEFGQVDYCAANAFLDAFASREAFRRKKRVVSINWSAWREVGMAVNTDLPPALKVIRERELNERGILPQEGVEVFKRVLSCHSGPQILVSTRPLVSIMNQPDSFNNSQEMMKIEEIEAAMSSMPSHSRPNLETAYAAPRNEIDQKICNIWQDSLGIEKVGINDNFFDLGGTSLTAIKVISALNKDLAANVPVASLYDGLTIAYLSDLVGGDSGGDALAQASQQAQDRREKMLLRKQYFQSRRSAREGKLPAR
jgi:acyl transferase domain-containing protein/acyl carrier protein